MFGMNLLKVYLAIVSAFLFSNIALATSPLTFTEPLHMMVGPNWDESGKSELSQMYSSSIGKPAQLEFGWVNGMKEYLNNKGAKSDLAPWKKLLLVESGIILIRLGLLDLYEGLHLFPTEIIQEIAESCRLQFPDSGWRMISCATYNVNYILLKNTEWAKRYECKAYDFVLQKVFDRLPLRIYSESEWVDFGLEQGHAVTRFTIAPKSNPMAQLTYIVDALHFPLKLFPFAPATIEMHDKIKAANSDQDFSKLFN